MLDEVDDDLRNLTGGVHRIHKVASQGALGHGAELGLGGILGEDHSAVLLDGGSAQRTVTPGTREDHTDGALLEFGRQAAKEAVDGKMAGRAWIPRHESELAVLQFNVMLYRDDVDVIRFGANTIRDLFDSDRFATIFAQHVGEVAFAVGSEVLNDDVGQPRVGRYGADEFAKGGETAC